MVQDGAVLEEVRVVAVLPKSGVIVGEPNEAAEGESATLAGSGVALATREMEGGDQVHVLRQCSTMDEEKVMMMTVIAWSSAQWSHAAGSGRVVWCSRRSRDGGGGAWARVMSCN